MALPSVVAHGYEASALADMCEVILDARKAGLLRKAQLHYADYCEILLRSFARVGIIVLSAASSRPLWTRYWALPTPWAKVAPNCSRDVSTGQRSCKENNMHRQKFNVHKVGSAPDSLVPRSSYLYCEKYRKPVKRREAVRIGRSRSCCPACGEVLPPPPPPSPLGGVG